MAEFGLGGGAELLKRRATGARLTIYAFVAAYIGVAIGSGLEGAGIVNLYAEYPDELSGLVGFVYLFAFVTFVASVVTVSMWIYRAHANLFAAGVENLEYTPGWSVGWFFIPIANLIKPFQAMRELWVRSHGQNFDSSNTPSPLPAWWGAWLGGNILSGVGSRVMESGSAAAGGILSALGAVFLILAAILLLRIIGEVTRAQSTGAISAHAFA